MIPSPRCSTTTQKIRVVATTALPGGTGGSIKDTEKTYALMMHMSKAPRRQLHLLPQLPPVQRTGSESRPQRVTAWHGIQMVGDINTHLHRTRSPTSSPPTARGPQGDVLKVNCATCHNGVNKPLYGFSMAKDYPELSVPNP